MKNKLIARIINCLIVIVFIWVLLNVLGIEMQYSILSIIILSVIGVILYLIIFVIYKILAYLFKDKKYLYAICGIVLSLSFLAIVFGGIVFFLGTPLSGEYEVEEVKVVDSSWNRVQIDYTKYNKDDYKVITIKKPFFVKVKKGDMIDVRYPINNPSKMSYVINHEIGLNIMMYGVSAIDIFIFGGFIVAVIVILTNVIKPMRERKKVDGKK